MTALHFGCRIDPGVAAYQGVLDQALLAERAGYDSVWMNDHVALPEIVSTETWMECFTALAALARDVPRVKLGTLVVANGFRNPALVAKMCATIDTMAEGRLILGIGAGGGQREYRRYGWPYPSNADRVRALGEAVQIIRSMWTEHAPSFAGRYHQIDKAVCEPRPSVTPKIMIGATGEQLSLRNAVRYGDIWSVNVPVDVYARKKEIVDRLCAEEGRDPVTLLRAVNLTVVVDSAGRAQDKLAKVLEGRPRMAPHLAHQFTAGTPEDVAAKIREYAALGVTYFHTYFWEADDAARLEEIDSFGREVIPLLR